MFHRLIASAFFMAALPALAQEALTIRLPVYSSSNAVLMPRTAALASIDTTPLPTQSAWIDLRQDAGARAKPQQAPDWVESVNFAPVPARAGLPARSVFRIRVARPRTDVQMLLFRLFFQDAPQQRPSLVVWDESGTQVLRSSPLGDGIDLPSSDTVILPMLGVSAIDIEVDGDGKNIRGAYLDWMTTRRVAHPLSAERRDLLPEPFAAAPPLGTPAYDTEALGTVTATLAPEVIRIGASVQAGAAFQFPLESLPLTALISFEVSAARVDAPPEIFVNGQSLGPVSLALPDLADPGYRGETERMIEGMRFRYTGWVRAQKLVAGAKLRAGMNDLVIIGGPATPASAIRATQIQLKYLWDKSDYLLDPK